MLKDHIGAFGEHGSEATSNQWTPSAPGGLRKVYVVLADSKKLDYFTALAYCAGIRSHGSI